MSINTQNFSLFNVFKECMVKNNKKKIQLIIRTADQVLEVLDVRWS